MHEFYFGNRYAADIIIGRIMDKVTVVNLDIVAQFYDLSLQQPSDNESEPDDSLRSINRISLGPRVNQLNDNQVHTVHQA